RENPRRVSCFRGRCCSPKVVNGTTAGLRVVHTHTAIVGRLKGGRVIVKTLRVSFGGTLVASLAPREGAPGPPPDCVMMFMRVGARDISSYITPPAAPEVVTPSDSRSLLLV